MEIIIDKEKFTGRNWFTETTVDELEKCLAIASKKTSENYQQIDKEADILGIITDIPTELIDEIPVNILHELFLKLTAKPDEKGLEIVNEWNGYVTKGFDTYDDITANRGEFRNFEKHLKRKTKRYISHILATFFSVDGYDYTYHYAKKLDEFKAMSSKVAIPYVFKAIEIIANTTKTVVDAEREEVQETT